jgi:hypothetical protein
MTKIKTSKRTYTWVVQKFFPYKGQKQGGRWRNLVDAEGLITFQTRQLARNVSREYNNIAKVPRSFRVKKLA